MIDMFYSKLIALIAIVDKESFKNSRIPFVMIRIQKPCGTPPKSNRLFFGSRFTLQKFHQNPLKILYPDPDSDP